MYLGPQILEFLKHFDHLGSVWGHWDAISEVMARTRVHICIARGHRKQCGEC